MVGCGSRRAEHSGGGGAGDALISADPGSGCSRSALFAHVRPGVAESLHSGCPHHIDAGDGRSLDVEADGRSATVRAPGPGHRHHLDRHRHSQDRAHLTPPDHSAREGPDQRTDIKMTEPADNELRPLSEFQGPGPSGDKAKGQRTPRGNASAGSWVRLAARRRGPVCRYPLRECGREARRALYAESQRERGFDRESAC